MKILILEPHGDDALLSCYSILETNHDIDILTFSARSSDGLEKHYPSIKGLMFCNINNLWYPDGKIILKTHEVHKAFTAGEPIAHNYLTKLKEIFGSEFDEDVEEVKEKILLTLGQSQPDIVVCPISVVHPYHIVVREAWRSLQLDIPTLYYADKYYIQNRYGKEMYEDLRTELHLDQEVNPGYEYLSEKNTRIANILCEVYPSESMLLRFYSDIILWYPCKYAYKSNEKVEELINDLE